MSELCIVYDSKLYVWGERVCVHVCGIGLATGGVVPPKQRCVEEYTH